MKGRRSSYLYLRNFRDNELVIDNISYSKEPVKLTPGAKYIVIDALYVNEIKLNIQSIGKKELLNEIRNKVFLYTDTPFAEYIPFNSVFTIDQIKKVDYSEVKSKDYSFFSVDSGMVIFINEEILMDFVSRYDYDKLISAMESLNIDYWHSITDNHQLSDLAIVIAPGVGEGVDFDGSGLYHLINVSPDL